MDIRWSTLPDNHLTNMLPVTDGVICLVEPSAATTDLHVVVSTPNIPWAIEYKTSVSLRKMMKKPFELPLREMIVRGPLRFTLYNKHVFADNDGFIPQFNLHCLLISNRVMQNIWMKSRRRSKEGPSASTAHLFSVGCLAFTLNLL